jgi:hypothetical protein
MEDYYLVDAKQEYTSYLISTLAPSMYTGFKDIFEQSKKILNGNSVFKNFQLLLSNVPNWNDHILNREVQDITKETGCDWLDNLITAVFVSHSKILTSVKIGNYRPKNKKIDLKIPDTNSFIHQCYIQSAREFYKNPMMFLEDTKMIRPDEILKNQKLAHSIIKESVMTTIRKLLPFRNILNEYLSLENQNNTIFIGNTSMGGSIAQSNIPTITLPPSDVQKPTEPSVILKQQASVEKTNLEDESSLEKKPVLPVIEDIPLPELNKSKKAIPKKLPVQDIQDNESLSTISSKENKKEEPTFHRKEESVSSISSTEKEVKVVGKELNLIDVESIEEQEQEEQDDFSLDMSMEIPKQNKGKKIESLDSASLNKFVNNIKEEFNNKEDESINLDDLSFLEQNKPIQKEEVSSKQDDFSFLEDKQTEQNKKDLDELSFLEQNKPVQQEERQLVPFVNYNEPESTIDIERIRQVMKEDGTILEDQIVSKKTFPLQHITPVLKEKSLDKSLQLSSIHNTKRTPPNNNIKKISIKYTAKIPFKTAPRKKPVQKGRTTLLEEAADDDSSEMVFR